MTGLLFIAILLVLVGMIHWTSVHPGKVASTFSLHGSDFFEGRFLKVLHAFLGGYNRARLPFLPIGWIREHLEASFDAFYRGFAYEGTGMGFGARATLFWNSGRKFESFIHQLSSDHIYQYYVGLGWWLHILFGFRQKGYERWLRQLDRGYGPILFDGVGFRTGLFHYGKQKQIIRKFAQFSEEYRRICYQGLGRSFWFLYKFDFDRVLEEMEHIEHRDRADFLSGVGLAVAYSRFDHMSFAFDIREKVPLAYQEAYTQGMAFGWEARRLQNRSYWEEILKSGSAVQREKVRDMIEVVYLAKEMIRNESPERYYVRWMDVTRSLILSNRGDSR
ncbi:DUF1702 family protein [Brevibacillus migulae]|uniref:DUF1702 family protein n=1 Tax=Brevibacillus migulae TaxID=1644114 RepID=UPI00106EED6E|nr:DUF1702 family protein [Brevibacillus migulae]